MDGGFPLTNIYVKENIQKNLLRYAQFKTLVCNPKKKNIIINRRKEIKLSCMFLNIYKYVCI